MINPDAQKQLQKYRKISALTAIISSAFLLHYTSQLFSMFYVSGIMNSSWDSTMHYGLLKIHPLNMVSWTLSALSFFALLPVLAGVILNEISSFILKRAKEPVRTFILFFQLAVTTFILFALFGFIFCFVFEINLYEDWFLLARIFHGNYINKMVSAFFLAATTFSYCGATLTRLKVNFSNIEIESDRKNNEKTGK